LLVTADGGGSNGSRVKMCLYRDTGSPANLRNPYPVFFLLSDTPVWINHPDVILLVN